MSTGCRDCRAGLDHCHGTMILHSLGRPECTEAECAIPELFTHAFVIDCDAVGCACARADDQEGTGKDVGASAHRVGA